MQQWLSSVHLNDACLWHAIGHDDCSLPCTWSWFLLCGITWSWLLLCIIHKCWSPHVHDSCFLPCICMLLVQCMCMILVQYQHMCMILVLDCTSWILPHMRAWFLHCTCTYAYFLDSTVHMWNCAWFFHITNFISFWSLSWWLGHD